MTEDRKAKMLERVRALLAQAANTPFSEEAATFQAKADELMTSYAIEEWELAKVGDERQKPEFRPMDISWWYDMEGGVEDALWSLMWACASHARCTIIYWRVGNRTMPVVGMPNDLDYLDLLFTDLMIQVVSQLDPKVDPNLSYFDNLKRFREAGASWPDTAKKMLEFSQFDPRPESGSFKVKQDQMTRDYRNECKKRGIPQNYNHFRTYGRNFAAGFVSMVKQRMSDMRQTTQSESDTSSSMALAIRDIKLVVAEAATEMFGSPPKSRGLVRDNRKVDFAARATGQQAGAKARIASNAPGIGGKRGQLNK